MRRSEVDFIALHRPAHMDSHQEPELIIGETKSFGQGDLLKADEFARLKKVGAKLPGVIIVISVMRDTFNRDVDLEISALATLNVAPHDSTGHDVDRSSRKKTGRAVVHRVPLVLMQLPPLRMGCLPGAYLLRTPRPWGGQISTITI